MISAVVISKNEERKITKCINSLKWCDEVLVVDDNSTDSTVELAKKEGARVIKNNLGDDFSRQRNFALENTEEDWVLFVDADERVSESLAFEISNVISQNLENYNGFLIPRVDVIWGKQLNFGENKIYLLRLGKKGKGKWIGNVHEQWKIAGRVGKLQNNILHYPHPTLTEFLQDINYYTNLRAQELFLTKTKASMYSVIFFPFGKFVMDYFIRGGILDGIHGLAIALLMSFHSFLVRSKLWLLWQKK